MPDTLSTNSNQAQKTGRKVTWMLTAGLAVLAFVLLVVGVRCVGGDHPMRALFTLPTLPLAIVGCFAVSGAYVWWMPNDTTKPATRRVLNRLESHILYPDTILAAQLHSAARDLVVTAKGTPMEDAAVGLAVQTLTCLPNSVVGYQQMRHDIDRALDAVDRWRSTRDQEAVATTGKLADDVVSAAVLTHA